MKTIWCHKAISSATALLCCIALNYIALHDYDYDYDHDHDHDYHYHYYYDHSDQITSALQSSAAASPASSQ